MQAWLINYNFKLLLYCFVLMVASSPAVKAETNTSCPDQTVLTSAVKTVIDKFTPDIPPADANTSAEVLAHPFDVCGKEVSSKPVCRYALATRFHQLYVLWNAVQPPTIKKDIRAKKVELENAEKGLKTLSEAAEKARQKAEQDRTPANDTNAVNAEAKVEEQQEKIKALEEFLGKLNASLNDVSKSVSAVIEAQSLLLLGDMEYCLSGRDHTASLCRQRRDYALYEVDRLLREKPTVDPAELNKKIDEANEFCAAIATSRNFDQKLAQYDLAQMTNAEVCEWKAGNWEVFLHDYYNLPKTKRAIHIESATFGDHIHGHICDARPYFQQQCGQLPGDTVAEAGSRSCLVTNITNRTALCGYDPSPQADLTLRISYYCGDQVQMFKPDKGRSSIDVPFTGATGIGRVDLVCKTERFIKTAAVSEDAAARAKRLKSLRDFFAQARCALTIPEIPN